MKIHFIAIGGSIMHSLAIALKQQGHEVSGSDDHIFDPARTRLADYEILPESDGWHVDRITADLDAVILGMHAFEDNPELKRAQELGLAVYSFPEFIFQQAKNKQRIAIAGSYGKTTITAMVMHVLEGAGKRFDYLVGAQVEGFENPVRLSGDAPVIIMEGDEYLASRIDPRPKFLLYHPHMVVVSGISWDHINVFPTEDAYELQFELLLQQLPKAGDIIYNEEDRRLRAMVETYTDANSQYRRPFKTPKYKVKQGSYEVKLEGEQSSVPVIGRHNMSNLASAWQVCKQLGVEIERFFELMQTFKGAAIRLETKYQSDKLTIIRDYAHAPAKVKASVAAVRESYPKHNFVACVELHTFSSLNAQYLPFYKGSLNGADQKLVFVDPEAVERRRMPEIQAEQLLEAFGDNAVKAIHTAEELSTHLNTAAKEQPTVVLLMSSGNFKGYDWAELTER